MSQNAILFMPDISGFTDFVENTAISHSKHIITELLELLLDNNTIDLELAEIEGDALFMYKLTDAINSKSIEAQIREMYIAFHKHLKRYEYERICQCGACASAYNLRIKFIVHYGMIEFISVKDSNKPYGSEVIKIHRLLKNKVPHKEYALFTENVLPPKEHSIIDTYDFGNITYSFQTLEELKSQIPDEKPAPHNPPKTKLFEISDTIEHPILDLYEIISNFEIRTLWTKGVDRLEYDKNRINRHGDKHNCLLSDGSKLQPETIKIATKPNELVYGEQTSDIPMLKRFAIYQNLKEQSATATKLTTEIYVDFKPIGYLMRPLITSKFQKGIKQNIESLKTYVASLK